jgi:hypothetical protein
MKGYTSAAYTLFFLLVSAISFFPVISSSQEAASVQVVDVEGSSLVSGRDLARARNEALQEALQKAAMQVAGRFITPQDMERKSLLIKERIASRADEFIQDYRVVSETTALDIHIVSIRATVFAEGIRKELQELGMIRLEEPKRPLTQISLTIRGIRTYGDYLRCRSAMKERISGIRTILPREALWGEARFDIMTEETLPVMAELIKEKMAAEIQHQGGLALEATLK